MVSGRLRQLKLGSKQQCQDLKGTQKVEPETWLRYEPFNIFLSTLSLTYMHFVFRKESQQLCRVEEKLPLVFPLR